MFLVRHGESQFNVIFNQTRQDPGIEDPELTQEGRRQAEAAAASLRHYAPTRILASPYTRALQTAKIIAANLGLPVTVEPLMRERNAFVCDIGTRRSELARLWCDLRFDHIEEVWWSDAEEREDVFHARCRNFRQIMRSFDDWAGTVAITHWGIIRALTGQRVANGAIVRFDPTLEHDIPHPDGW